jgi:hypothetical protein
VIDRARFLDVIKSGALTHSMMESEDLSVRIYGDTATVTALTTAKGKFMGQGFYHSGARDRSVCKAKWTMAMCLDTIDTIHEEITSASLTLRGGLKIQHQIEHGSWGSDQAKRAVLKPPAIA